MKTIDAKSNTYIDSSEEINNKNPKFKIGYYVRISKYRNIFAKVTLQIGLKKFLWLKKVKNTVPWTYVINDLKREEIAGTFYKNEMQKANQKELGIEKVVKSYW